MKIKHKLVGGIGVCALLTAVAATVSIVSFQNIHRLMKATSLNLSSNISRQVSDYDLEKDLQKLLESIDKSTSLEELEKVRKKYLTLSKKEPDENILKLLKEIISSKESTIKIQGEIDSANRKFHKYHDEMHKIILTRVDDQAFDTEIMIDDYYSSIKEIFKKSKNLPNSDQKFSDKIDKTGKSTVKALNEIKAISSVYALINEVEAIINKGMYNTDSAFIKSFSYDLKDAFSNIRNNLKSINDQNSKQLLIDIHDMKNIAIFLLDKRIQLLHKQQQKAKTQALLIKEIHKQEIITLAQAKKLKSNTEKDLSDINKMITKNRDTLFFLGITAILIAIILAIKVRNNIINPLNNIVNQAEAIAVGELPDIMEVKTNDEIGALETSFNKIISNSRQLVSQAQHVAQGEYIVEIEPRSEKDSLSLALIQMTKALAEFNEKSKKQDWFKSGQARLNEEIRGDLKPSTLGKKILIFLANFLDAQVGALYSVDDKDDLMMLANYAYDKKQAKFNRKFKKGEGIVGQAAEEQRTFILDEIPENYIKIKTSTSEIVPKTIAVVPFIYNKKTYAVLELGFLHKLSDQQTAFLEKVGESIAIVLESAKARVRTIDLLGKTQQQSEELQAQQEELRVTNEELEEQTKALKNSESELQAQQEELRVTNEELEEQTKAIQIKNEELNNAKKELENRAKDLELASKYKSEFLANMSHELRTPLNSILILAQLLSENKSGQLSDKDLEFAKTIRNSGSDLLELINDILDLAKVEAGKLQMQIEKYPLANISDEMQRLFSQMAKDKNIEFSINIEPGLPEEIETDSQRLKQIIRNLLSNSFKFTKQGSITLRIFQPENIQLKRSGLLCEKSIGFSVSDTGIGIPLEKQAIIFEAFQQADGSTNRNFGGTGLGLSISREFASMLGGELQLESEPNNGTTFTLYLPNHLTTGKKKPAIKKNIQKEIEEDAKEKTAIVKSALKDRLEQTREMRKISDNKQVQIVDGEDKVLLIVEDDQNFSNVLVELAEEKGFKCLVAEDGETALEILQKQLPNAILLDIGLPGIDGYAVMDKIKENPRLKHIPVHFISGMEDKSNEAIKMGAVGFLAKPISPEKLNEAFKNISSAIAKPIKKILLVEDDKVQRESIKALLDSKELEIIESDSGENAIELFSACAFDSMILDLSLTDMSGFDLLRKLQGNKNLKKTPVIIYTGRDLTSEEHDELRAYSESIIVKGPNSPARLFDEVLLFLHHVESELPSEQKKKVPMVHDKETLFDGKKILLVDDDMRNVFALTSVLEMHNFKVCTAKNGQEGLAKVKSETPDIVLMDIMMPIMDGYQAMEEIRKDKANKKLPIIALTAKAMKGDREKCIDSGASDYLAKPVDTEKLISLLRVWLYQ